MKTLILVLLSAGFLASQESDKPRIVNIQQADAPPPVNFEEKYNLLRARVAAFMRLVELKDARIRRLQAQIDEMMLQERFDSSNEQIFIEMRRLQEKYNAQGWEFNESYNWVRKEKTQ
jgi:hypothetical protein